MHVLKKPLAAAAEAFNLAVASEGRATCTTLDAYKHEHALNLPPLCTVPMMEAGGWVNGVLAWITVELGMGILGEGRCCRGAHLPRVRCGVIWWATEVQTAVFCCACRQYAIHTGSMP